MTCSRCAGKRLFSSGKTSCVPVGLLDVTDVYSNTVNRSLVTVSAAVEQVTEGEHLCVRPRCHQPTYLPRGSCSEGGPQAPGVNCEKLHIAR
jgi:hypothetical protein